MQITLDTGLKPWLIASKDDAHPTLSHVQVCRAPAGDEHGLLAATDTFRLIVVPCHLDDVDEGFTSVLIPAPWLDTIHKARPTGSYVTTIDLDLDRKVARALTKTAVSETGLGEGQFPNWLRILDGEFCRASCPAALDDWHYFSPKQLMEIGHALGLENGHAVSWFQRSPTAPLVILPPQADRFAGLGLLMPGNTSHEARREHRLGIAERWLCPKIGMGVLEQLEKAAAAADEDLASQLVTPEKEPVPA